jgi:hypothetical protein
MHERGGKGAKKATKAAAKAARAQVRYNPDGEEITRHGRRTRTRRMHLRRSPYVTTGSFSLVSIQSHCQ